MAVQREVALKTGIIVTRQEEERIELKNGTVKVVPAWRFLLELTEGAG